METERICPSCQRPLPPEVPLGLCPECLLKAGLNTGTQPGSEGSTTAGFVPPPVAELSRLFPQLEVLEFIGRGGMGAVYKGRQPGLDRLVALKILPPAAAGDPGFAERFNREARALARLSHPNIVAVYDFGQVSTGTGEPPAALPGTLHYLVMEFVDGGNLRQIERAGRLAPEQALAIVPQICEALQFAHNEGIVHRDIKPENILLDRKGRVKITDFGIAKILGRTAETAPLTGVGDVVGTPHYMAPEQIEKPRTVDHRADIYSLGVVFYEMLTGELPLGKFAPPSRKVQVDVRLDEVVLHALEKEPELRYQQASDVKTAVETIARSEGKGSKTEEPGAKPDAEALEREVLTRDYLLNVGSCLRRGWALVRSDFWPTVGVTALILALLGMLSSIAGTVDSTGERHHPSGLALLLSGPFWGGLYLFFLMKIRGERASVETAFSGFKLALLQLFLAGLVTSLLTGLGFVCLVLPGVYLSVAWLFTLPLVIDKRIDFWPAMRLSRKTISKHWWKFLGFLMVLGLLNLGGLLLCGVGLFVTLPVTFAALMCAYEDVFDLPGHPSAPPAQGGASGTEGRAQFEVAAPPHGLRSWLTTVFIGVLVVFLLVLAVVACLTLEPISFGGLAAGALLLAALLRIRQAPLPRGFLAPFLMVFLLVFGAAAFITFVLPESFLGTARVKVTPKPAEVPPAPGSRSASGGYDPFLIQTEFEVMQSEEILGPVIKALDLDREWGKRYGRGEPLKPAEAMALFKSRMDLRPVRNTSIIAVRVFGEHPDEPARIANEIARVYQNRNNLGPLQVEIVDRAYPALRPIRPNKPLNLTLGALLGLVLGTAAGAAWVARQGRKTPG